MELKINELRTGELYQFLGENILFHIYSAPDPFSRIIGYVSSPSIAMFIEAVPWSSDLGHCMMVKVICGELIGYLTCCCEIKRHYYYGIQNPFQAHKFFKVDNH